MAKFWRAPQTGDVFSIPDHFIERVSEAIARGNRVLPFAADDTSLSLYVSEEHPDLEFLRARLQKYLKQNIHFHPLPHSLIEGCLEMYYPATYSDFTEIRDCAEQFRFVCPRTWDSLYPTDNPEARHCPECNETVYLCLGSDDLEKHRGKRMCFALGDTVGGI